MEMILSLFDSVVSTSAEATRFRFIAFVVGYWTTWRTNATFKIGNTQGLSAKERLRAVSVGHFIQFPHKKMPLNSSDKHVKQFINGFAVLYRISQALWYVRNGMVVHVSAILLIVIRKAHCHRGWSTR